MDLIITWPVSVDYPNWRSFIRLNRFRFEKVVVSFSETNYGNDYRNFVIEAMAEDDITFLFPENCRNILFNNNADWRNNSINACLEVSNSDWVWFTEQDLFIKDNNLFWDIVSDKINNFDIIGHRVNNDTSRYHPFCLFVKRDIIEKTQKYFGVVPDVWDHFAFFSHEIDDVTSKIKLLDGDLFYHMNGLSYNFYLMSVGIPITYYPDEFYSYLKNCLLIKDVPISDFYKYTIMSMYPWILDE